ncbi:hypothetical protein LSTR_LSTR009824 [Laodelphax striatellus]|uniref:RNA helicase n=1 Tax=Laodelphax striatellus TaxID=195883 RepID=A0A482WHU1_LAOST|nr:hypothetical protein LSTR_LSTR009824 [Laodelphax striatellus]
MESKYGNLNGKLPNINSPMKRPSSEITINIHTKKFNDGKSQDTSNSVQLLEQRKSLPVYKVRKRILEEINKHATLIVIGETGSGKTTQIPHFIHNAQLAGNMMIGITQPRRVAAVTIAQRVAQEMHCTVGGTVGYCVRFEDSTSPATKLKFMTDGMLLREAMLDEHLKSYNVIILDEAHERTVNTDILFGIVKKAQVYRAEHRSLAPLKVIVMSATMDVDHFSNYFNKAPILYLEGRQYTVDIYHALKPQDDYCFACLVTIFQIHKEAPASEDILVFLTGQEEIESMCSTIRAILKDPQCKGPPMKVCVLYATLNPNKQLEVFNATAAGTRKVILSTNIAETSVTISGVKHVVDSGMVKARFYKPSTGLNMLRVQSISQAQAWQRAGRAGRQSNGACYRVYTKLEFDGMMKNTVPEIQRCGLSGVVLQLLAIGIDPVEFDLLDKPQLGSIIEAINLLQQLGAIDKNAETPILTDLGKKMAQFPLDPRFAKVILSASDFDCLEEVLSVVAVLSVDTIYVSGNSSKEAVTEARRKFMSPTGDIITYLNIYRCYSNTKNRKKWCFENYLNFWNLEYAHEVRTQLKDLCQSNNMRFSSSGSNHSKVIMAFLTGLFMNTAELQQNKQYITVATRQLTSIHPSSAMFGSLPPCVLYTEMVQTNKCYLRCVSQIDPGWLVQIIPNYAHLYTSSRNF